MKSLPAKTRVVGKMFVGTYIGTRYGTEIQFNCSVNVYMYLARYLSCTSKTFFMHTCASMSMVVCGILCFCMVILLLLLLINVVSILTDTCCTVFTYI